MSQAEPSLPSNEEQPAQSNQELRFDGFYRSKLPEYSYYLRFYADGAVVAISSSDEPFQAVKLVNKSFYGSSKGRYTLDGAKLDFSATSQNGTVDYSGTVQGETLQLNSFSHINNIRNSRAYQFVEIPGLPPDEPGDVTTFYV